MAVNPGISSQAVVHLRVSLSPGMTEQPEVADCLPCLACVFQEDFHFHSIYKARLSEFPLDDLPSGMTFVY